MEDHQTLTNKFLYKFFNFYLIFGFYPFLISSHNPPAAYTIQVIDVNMVATGIQNDEIKNHKADKAKRKTPTGIAKKQKGIVKKSAGNKRNRYGQLYLSKNPQAM